MQMGSRRNERLESKKAAGVNPRPTRGMGFALCLCNTKAKLAIKYEKGKTYEFSV